MTRLAAARRVYAFEPMPQRARLPLLGASQADGLTVLTPYLPGGVSPAAEPRVLAPLVESVLEGDGVSMPILWICDAHSFPVVAGVPIAATVHDAGSAGLDPEPSGEMLRLADLVLARDTTQLRRLAQRHPRVHLVPDGVDADRPGTPPSMPPAASSTTWSAPSTPAMAGGHSARADGTRIRHRSRRRPTRAPPIPADAGGSIAPVRGAISTGGMASTSVHPARAIAIGGAAAGVVDLLGAIVIFWPAAPAGILRSIAAGVVGSAAARRRRPGLAALGLLLHFVVAIGAAAVFVPPHAGPAGAGAPPVDHRAALRLRRVPGDELRRDPAVGDRPLPGPVDGDDLQVIALHLLGVGPAIVLAARRWAIGARRPAQDRS